MIIINHLLIIIPQLARQPDTTIQQLQSAMAAFQQQYDTQATGPSKWQEFNAFLTGPFSRLLEDVTVRQQRVMEEARKAAEAQRALEHSRAQQVWVGGEGGGGCVCIWREVFRAWHCVYTSAMCILLLHVYSCCMYNLDHLYVQFVYTVCTFLTHNLLVT